MKKVKNSLPVSRKYYERLQARVRYIFRTLVLGSADEANDFAYTVMMGHAREDDPSVYMLDKTLSIIYVTLRHEVRTAVERSRNARERARRRAMLKKAAAANEKAECPVMGHPAVKNINPTVLPDEAMKKSRGYSSPCDFSAYSLSSLSCTSAGTSS